MRFLAAALYYTAIVGGNAYLIFWLEFRGWWWMLAVLVSVLVAIRKDVQRTFKYLEKDKAA
jgi:hypothetical protein